MTGEAFGPVYRGESYDVRFFAPAGYAFTEQGAAGSTASTDSDADELTGIARGVTAVVWDFEAGDPFPDLTTDAGMLYLPPVNLTADNDVNGEYNSADDQIEADEIGKLVFVNMDDDNGDSVMDYQSVGPVVGEDDLAPVRVGVPSWSDADRVRLKVEGDSSAIRLWSAPDRTGPLDPTTEYVVGQDVVPGWVYVEGLSVGLASLQLELLTAPGTLFANGAPGGNRINIRSTDFELDVTDDLSTGQADDGFWNYMPGYRGTTPVLSTGAFNGLTQLKPQPLHAVLNGIGTAAGVSKVGAWLRDVSSHEGYSGNTADPEDGNVIWGNMIDVSFSASGPRVNTDTTQSDGGSVAADKSHVNFFVRDYAATASLGVAVYGRDGLLRGSSVRQVVRDTDGDGMQDGWELKAVADYKSQYGLDFTIPELEVFGAGEPGVDSNELRDVDSTPNLPGMPNDNDGGANMVPHKTAGDSLTPFQEYRGFVLDGGEFDGTGGGGHTGGHKRLSPVHKELLLEVDAMASTPAMPTPAQLTGVLDTVAKGYSDATNGAGIRVYWVIDEPAATHKVFTSSDEAAVWAEAHRNSQLHEFVHLMFADNDSRGTAYGYTLKQRLNAGGSFSFTSPLQADAPAADYGTWLASSAAHELGHAILDTIGANGFDDGGHVKDPNENGTDVCTYPPPPAPRILTDPGDQPYLMVEGRFRIRGPIIFDNWTRKQIDLTNKFSVED